MKEYKALKPYLLKHSWTYDEATKIIAGFIDAHDEIEKELDINHNQGLIIRIKNDKRLYRFNKEHRENQAYRDLENRYGSLYQVEMVFLNKRYPDGLIPKEEVIRWAFGEYPEDLPWLDWAIEQGYVSDNVKVS